MEYVYELEKTDKIMYKIENEGDGRWWFEKMKTFCDKVLKRYGYLFYDDPLLYFNNKLDDDKLEYLSNCKGIVLTYKGEKDFLIEKYKTEIESISKDAIDNHKYEFASKLIMFLENCDKNNVGIYLK